VEFLQPFGIVIEEVVVQIAELADFCKRDRFAAALEFGPLAECTQKHLLGVNKLSARRLSWLSREMAHHRDIWTERVLALKVRHQDLEERFHACGTI
jgi:hypothetical protein